MRKLLLSYGARKLNPPCVSSALCRQGFLRSARLEQQRGHRERMRALEKEHLPSLEHRLAAAAAKDLRGRSFLRYRATDATPGLRRTPVLMIQGAKDPFYPADLASGLAKRLPKARLVVLEACGHLPFLEAPRRFLAEVRRFLGVPPQQTPWASSPERALTPLRGSSHGSIAQRDEF